MKTQIKKLLAIAFVLLLSISTKAQNNISSGGGAGNNNQIISGGIILGASTGAVEIEDIGQGFTDVIQGKNIYGVEIGPFANVKLGPFYVRPELLYNFRRGEVVYKDMIEENERNVSFNMHRLEVPVLIGLYVLGPLAIEVGPVYNYAFAVTESYNANEVQIGRNGVGYRAGVTLDVSSLILNVSYEGVTYYATTNRAKIREPYKLIFGIGIRLNGGGMGMGGSGKGGNNNNVIINN